MIKKYLTKIKRRFYCLYVDFKTSSKAILKGILSKRDFREAQENDDFCSSILNSPRMHRGFVVIEGLLYARRQNRLRLCLPIALLDIVINAKHFSVFGLHFSKSRIQRDIKERYHVPHSILNKRLKRLIKSFSVFHLEKLS